ncbi:MAG: hypothetical protein ABIE25_08715 [Thermoplasmatota archaeon]|nr:hypothetical protein [Candidatus Thermoplasmatota archaeon]
MRCPNCGEENISFIGLCKKCGKSLAPPYRFGGTRIAPQRPVASSSTKAPTPEPSTAKPGPVDYKDIPKKMKFDYERAVREQSGRTLAAVQALMQQIESPQPDVRKLMLDASNLISRQLGIMNVAVGLKGPDGLFRYDIMVGLREDAVAERKKIAYKKEEFYDAGPYKGYEISRYTRLYLSEDHPYADLEAGAYNRPILLKDSKRRSPNEALEGDYVDVHIFDANNELIGWIETSGTRTGQLPDATAIRWMELMGCIIGIALRKKAWS